MNVKRLKWDNFNWDDFQVLTLHLAENLYPDCYFEEHLKQGAPQEGIDLKSFQMKDGKQLAIQCKREKKLTVGDINKIVADFTEERRRKTSLFILATSADLQSAKLQQTIEAHQKEFWENEGIQFLTWDQNFIELHLQKYRSIVAYYFGKEEADRFCHPQLRHTVFPQLKEVPFYIPRKVTRLRDNKLGLHGYLEYLGYKTESLSDLLLHNPLSTKRLLVIGDAYQGKSSYLLHTAFEIHKRERRLQPLVVELKDYDALSIETILDSLYGDWKSLPLKEILLVIDGLDEVPTDRFGTMLSHIKMFTDTYAPVNIILSCRKLFFHHYNVRDTLTNFEVHELYPLQEEDIRFYTEIRLGGLSADFLEKASSRGLQPLLYHPFYLVQIVERFASPPHDLPKSKIEVLDDFIEKTSTASLRRKTGGSDLLKHHSQIMQRAVRKLAFALQYAGQNSFPEETIQQILSADERKLLYHNPVLSISAHSWSFTNALFQEHLAARVMVDMPYDRILEFVAIGKHIRKIKTKWIQTFSSLLSLLDDQDPLREQLIGFVRQDNIEILFQTEASRYTASFRLQMLKELIQKCIRLNTRPLLTYEETIGSFIGSHQPAQEYLLEKISKDGITDRVKIVCCRIIRNTRLSPQTAVAYITLMKAELSNAGSAEYGSELVEVLVNNRLGDTDLIQYLIEQDRFENDHPFRDSVYELILVHDQADRFYQFGLEGLPSLKRYNAAISHGGSEVNLEQLLLSTQERPNLYKLFELMQGEAWNQIYQYRSRKEGFQNKLFRKLKNWYEKDPLIIFGVARYLRNLGKYYLRSEALEIDTFLEETGTYGLVVRMLCKEMLEDGNWETGAVVTPNNYDYLLFEWEEGGYEPIVLNHIRWALVRKNKEDRADDFYQLAIDATEGAIINKTREAEAIAYAEKERLRQLNDGQVISSVEQFKAGLKKLFSAYGKQSLQEEDLFMDPENDPRLWRANSQYIYNFLFHYKDHQSLSLNQCLRVLEDEGAYEDFRAEELLAYNYQHGENSTHFQAILQNYYYRFLPDANFENCTWVDEAGYHEKRREVRLGKLFEKFRFTTSDDDLIRMIWLDSVGPSLPEHRSSTDKPSLSELIVGSLSSNGVFKLKKQLLQNLKKEINHDGVLASQVALCRHLGVTGAAGLILAFIKEGNLDQSYLVRFVDSFLALNGEREELLPILEQLQPPGGYLFFHLVKKLHEAFPKNVEKRLEEVLEFPGAKEDDCITTALYLSNMGCIKGFQYLVEHIALYNKAPNAIYAGFGIQKLGTKEALEQLNKLIHLVLEKESEGEKRFYDSPKNLILDWLHELARKSEKDLQLVIDFLEQSIEIFQNLYPDIALLNWYNSRLLEDFRDSDKQTRTYAQIRRVLQALESEAGSS